MMATRTKDDDGDLAVRERDEHMRANVPAKRGAPTDKIGIEPLVVMTGGDPLTVTHQNPTPPTNLSYNSYGTPPTTAGAAFVDDGVVDGVGYGATTAIAAPLSSIAGVSGTASEATGTVVIDTDTNNTTSITVMGAYTNTPNASHISSNPPATLPTITGLLPVAPVGNGGTTALTVNGTGFRRDSVIQVAGVPQTTQYNSATQVSTMNAPKRTSAGNSAITVNTAGTATAATNWVFS